MLRLIFAGLIMGTGFFAALWSRFAALQLYVWFALFRPQEWVWIPLWDYRLSTIFGLLLIVPCVLVGQWPVIGHALSVGALGFLATCYFATREAANQIVGMVWMEFMVKLVVVCLFATRLLSTPARIILLLGTICASFGFHTVKSGVGSLLAGGLRFNEGPGGAFIDNNGYAVGCVMIIPFFVAFAQNPPRKWMAWPAWLGVPLTMVTVISTFSRGGLLSLVAATATFMMLQKRRSKPLIAALLLLPLLTYVPLPSGYTDRMATIGSFEEVGEGSALGRLHFWRVALDMAADRPLGVGLWNFETTYDQYDFSGGLYGGERAVHNSHLQVLTETGWLGAAWWVGLFAVAMFLAFRARRNAALMEPERAYFTTTVANALIASMVAFLVGGTFVSIAYNDLTWLTFAIVAGFDRISRLTAAAPQPVPVRPVAVERRAVLAPTARMRLPSQ